MILCLLWMTKLIALEVEICFSPQSMHNKAISLLQLDCRYLRLPYHFVQSQTSINYWGHRGHVGHEIVYELFNEGLKWKI